MRNQFGGSCYRCGEWVEPGKGHFERHRSGGRGWRVQHANCAITWRGTNKRAGDGVELPSQPRPAQTAE